jgi:hypothetical protein
MALDFFVLKFGAIEVKKYVLSLKRLFFKGLFISNVRSSIDFSTYSQINKNQTRLKFDRRRKKKVSLSLV